MRRLCTIAPLAVASVLLVTVGRGQVPDGDKPPSLTAAQKARLEGAARLSEEAEEELKAGRDEVAIKMLRDRLAIEREVLGEGSDAAIDTLTEIAALERDRDDLSRARRDLAKARALAVRRGEKHHSVRSLDVGIAYIDTLSGLEPQQRAALRHATRINDEAPPPSSAANIEKALSLFRESLRIRRSILGENHYAVAASLNNIGSTLANRGDFAGAVKLHEQSLRIRRDVFGEESPEAAESHNNLGHALRLLRRPDDARPHLEAALRIREGTLGGDSVMTAQSLNNLGLLYSDLGLYEPARPLFERSLQIRRKQSRNPLVIATACNNMGILLLEVGDYAAAKRSLEEALDLLSKAFPGDDHVNIAATLNVLGNLLLDQGDVAGAAAAFERSRTILDRLGPKLPNAGPTRNSLGIVLEALGRFPEARAEFQAALGIFEAIGDRVQAATVRHNLAGLREREGQLAEAAREMERVLVLREAIYPKGHYEIGQTLNNLAIMKERQGDLREARRLQERAIDIAEKSLDPRHPTVAAYLANLAGIGRQLGDHDSARRSLEKSLKITRDNMFLSFGCQSERQQLAMTGAYGARLGGYLSLEGPIPAEAAYAFVLGWKGAVFARQRRRRLFQNAATPEVASLVRRLQETTATLATLALAPRSSLPRDEWNRRVQELSRDKERLEGELATRDARFRPGRDTDRREPRHLLDVLPADAALVDFVEYAHYQATRDSSGRLNRSSHIAAFVLRKNAITRVELGPSDAIAKAIDRWLESVTDEKTGIPPGPATEVGGLIWSKLIGHLGGVKLLLVSPDGPLGRFPFGCLPGARAGRYLIEDDVPIAIVPVPQLLPEILAPADVGPDRSKASMLIVGRVDYGASPGDTTLAQVNRARRPAARGGHRMIFPQLGRTKEIDDVSESFRRAFPLAPEPVVLGGARATEGAFRDAAPNYDFLHLSTHGFYAPEEVRSALDRFVASAGVGPGATVSPALGGLNRVASFHPGLLSGLAFAGANLGARTPDKGDPTADDGIVTALEVAEHDLTRSRMVVLSACKSGRGQEAGGEGMIGLQRAFQMAGAHTVVASLWDVDDEITALLMTKFYRNLWQEKMTPLHALHAAQLEVKNKGPGDSAHPRYWAAWVLSGDPGARAR